METDEGRGFSSECLALRDEIFMDLPGDLKVNFRFNGKKQFFAIKDNPVKFGFIDCPICYQQSLKGSNGRVWTTNGYLTNCSNCGGASWIRINQNWHKTPPISPKFYISSHHNLLKVFYDIDHFNPS